MASRRRLIRELNDLAEDLPHCCSAGPPADDMWHWQGTVLGPRGTPYEGGVFFFDIDLTEYSRKPPQIHFTTQIVHPLVHPESGIIHAPHKIDPAAPDGRESPLGGIGISLNKVDGTQIDFFVDPADRIFRVKQYIHLKMGIPPHYQRLICNGQELHDCMSVRESEIAKNSSVQLVCTMEGTHRTFPSITHWHPAITIRDVLVELRKLLQEFEVYADSYEGWVFDQDLTRRWREDREGVLQHIANETKAHAT